MFNVLTKKFKTNKSVWIKYNIYLLKQDRGADSAQLLKRALQALPQRKRKYNHPHISRLHAEDKLVLEDLMPPLQSHQACILMFRVVYSYLVLDIETISKFAQLEYQIGNPMKGRTMFEELLSTYPKKIDLWTVYIDQVPLSFQPFKRS